MNRRKPMKAITMIELGIAGVLLLVLVLLVYWYTDGLSSFRPNENTIQYSKGIKLEFTDGAVFRNTNGEISIVDNNESLTAAKSPIIHTNDNSLTLVENMAFHYPDGSDAFYRVNALTHLTKNNEAVTFKSGRKTAQTLGGFLFDGNDIYIFLEDVTLEVGNNEIYLPALSYVVSKYDESVEYYNSETKENKVMGVSGVEAIATSNSYKLNLAKDVIYTKDGEALLFTAIDRLSVIEME